jgi:hypothetical protein
LPLSNFKELFTLIFDSFSKLVTFKGLEVYLSKLLGEFILSNKINIAYDRAEHKECKIKISNKEAIKRIKLAGYTMKDINNFKGTPLEMFRALVDITVSDVSTVSWPTVGVSVASYLLAYLRETHAFGDINDVLVGLRKDGNGRNLLGKWERSSDIFHDEIRANYVRDKVISMESKNELKEENIQFPVPIERKDNDNLNNMQQLFYAVNELKLRTDNEFKTFEDDVLITPKDRILQDDETGEAKNRFYTVSDARNADQMFSDIFYIVP